MVMIINGYVSLSKLNSGFLYIVVVNLGACACWGFIDGFVYFISKSIERNDNRKKLLLLKSLKLGDTSDMARAKTVLHETFLDGFDAKGKEEIAKDLVANAADASIEEGKMNKEEILGWISIMFIFLATGFVLALPFLVLRSKINAWLVSNGIGSAWLFWYGIQIGKNVGKNRILLGLFLTVVGIAFLAMSYFIWSGR
jgi:VIT1/CCC1 family predicted Fe2+/Mn2+ transporter